MSEIALVVHGGTGMVEAGDELGMAKCLQAALEAGHGILGAGGSATDAVTAAVLQLEACGLFTAGAGAVPQRDGVVRHDASLMSSGGTAGAVIGVSRICSPIAAARVVHDLMRHSTLAGDVADDVLEALGGDVASDRPSQRKGVGRCVQEYLAEGGSLFGTVGAVARDHAGGLAAATSTGGYPTALPGRAGDSGALGVGTFASPYCAISCTGDGDRFLVTGLAAAVDAYLEAGLEVERAIKLALGRLERAGARGGFILVPAQGAPRVVSNVPILRFAAIPTASFHSEPGRGEH